MIEESFLGAHNGDLKSDKHVSICMGCGQEIYDQWILRVAPDLEWHAACLKCADCHQFLDEAATCFVRDGKIYCKQDYVRLFGQKCCRCGGVFRKMDYVMRARDKIYHVDCFSCVACDRRLEPGQQFALRDEGLFCKDDHDILEKQQPRQSPRDTGAVVDAFSPFAPLNPLRVDQASLNGQSPPVLTPLSTCPPGGPRNPYSPLGRSSGPPSSDSVVITGGHSSGNSSGGSTSSKKEKRKEQKTTRVRTVLNEKQLHTLRTCYGANPRPDALMKEQLVEMTGLSPRVIRVWFQNKRCKDKKKQILMKQLQQQQEKHQALTGLRMQGVGPLIATSPTRHDVPMVQAMDIQQYAQNPAIWQSINEYQPLKPGPGLMEGSVTPFQQLMHGFGDPHMDPTHPMSYLTGASGPVMGMDGSLTPISPSANVSDLSSPSCSE